LSFVLPLTEQQWNKCWRYGKITHTNEKILSISMYWLPNYFI